MLTVCNILSHEMDPTLVGFTPCEIEDVDTTFYIRY